MEVVDLDDETAQELLHSIIRDAEGLLIELATIEADVKTLIGHIDNVTSCIINKHKAQCSIQRPVKRKESDIDCAKKEQDKREIDMADAIPEKCLLSQSSETNDDGNTLECIGRTRPLSFAVVIDDRHSQQEIQSMNILKEGKLDRLMSNPKSCDDRNNSEMVTSLGELRDYISSVRSKVAEIVSKSDAHDDSHSESNISSKSRLREDMEGFESMDAEAKTISEHHGRKSFLSQKKANDKNKIVEMFLSEATQNLCLKTKAPWKMLQQQRMSRDSSNNSEKTIESLCCSCTKRLSGRPDSLVAIIHPLSVTSDQSPNSFSSDSEFVLKTELLANYLFQNLESKKSKLVNPDKVEDENLEHPKNVNDECYSGLYERKVDEMLDYEVGLFNDDDSFYSDSSHVLSSHSPSTESLTIANYDPNINPWEAYAMVHTDLDTGVESHYLMDDFIPTDAGRPSRIYHDGDSIEIDGVDNNSNDTRETPLMEWNCHTGSADCYNDQDIINDNVSVTIGSWDNFTFA